MDEVINGKVIQGASSRELSDQFTGERTMITRKSTFLLLVMFGGIFTIIFGCGGDRGKSAVGNRPADDRSRPNREVTVRRQSPRPYGKLKVPAGLFVDFIEPESPGAPASIIVSASTDIVASSGVMTLRIPPIGAEPRRTEVLWSGAPSDFIAEAREYTVGPLPLGRYHFAAIFEFTPDRENAEELVTSESLYVDVRADKILSSNVSFKQIERLELYGELEARVLRNLNPGLAAADPEATAHYRELMEAANPGLIESEIAELKATDPEVARRIAELNSTKATTAPDSGTAGTNEKAQPVFEEAVPVPEGLGQ